MPIDTRPAYLELMDQLGGLLRCLKFLGYPGDGVCSRWVLGRASFSAAQQNLLHDLSRRLEYQRPGRALGLPAVVPGLGGVVALIFGEPYSGSNLGEIREWVVQLPPPILGGIR